tara:strand:+ start:922 stop:2898 length:1977 start_codon:yes stop_codon:yes gene_type:complete
MKNNLMNFYEQSLEIRYFEEKLLELFSEGKISGTTHTCIGQENNAVGVISALKKNDIVLSNHRCHGHFLKHTKNFHGLLYEILGSKKGVCGGIGGSQHLFFRKIFYSNGILGGNVPMAAGLALASKKEKLNKIICLFIGDGSFGEGTIFETLNLISILNLPILIVIEDNGIAQTTNTKNTLSNSVEEICKSFLIKTTVLKYEDAINIYNKTKILVKDVRKNKPNILVLKSTRLGPHSKGDDTRTKKELIKIAKLDPLKKLERKIKNGIIKKTQKKIHKKIEKIFNEVQLNTVFENKFEQNLENLNKQKNLNYLTNEKIFDNFNGKRFGEKVNFFFHHILKNDKKIFFLGEDIDDPYGGAFKISKGLKTKFNHQVFSTPISEASITGLASGMSIQGFKPIVEIMFGDFLTLTFDQIVNNISKFHEMYNKGISNPIIIRTPMGGRRGYGPTHSQSLEKFFLGIHGLNVYALNTLFPIQNIYYDAFQNFGPNLIIENKTQYNFILDDLKKQEFSQFSIKHDIESFKTELSLTNFSDDKATIITYGGLTELIIEYVFEYYLETEIPIKIVSLAKLNPINFKNIKNSLKNMDKVLVAEESDGKYGFSSEIISNLSEDKECKNIDFKRITSNEGVIPASVDLEKKYFINKDKLFDIMNKLLDNA